MRRWILVALNLSLINGGFACELKSSVVSLSGTTTILFEKLGLLQKLRAISVFNPVDGYAGKVLPGGVFLSQNSISELSRVNVFFDESQELRKSLVRAEGSKLHEVKTRGLYPSQAVREALKLMREVLSNCDSAIIALQKKTEHLEREVAIRFPKNSHFVFYLGELKGRLPEMLMVNDGMVKYLVEKGNVRTYPSSLAYVNWSARVMSSLPSPVTHVGLVDSAQKNTRKIKRLPRGITLTYPGVLVPGLSQVEAFSFLSRSL